MKPAYVHPVILEGAKPQQGRLANLPAWRRREVVKLLEHADRVRRESSVIWSKLSATRACAP
jgi:hypothetical protein